MKCDKKMMRLYAVTDRAWSEKVGLYEQVRQALAGGVTCVQLREKQLSDEAFIKEALEIKALCHAYNVPLFINDNVNVALACGADGIHVGQDDMDPSVVRSLVKDQMMIGVSCHSVKEAIEAVNKGADCIGVGAAFATTTKKDTHVLSHETIKEICSAVDIPVVAIGGIKKHNIMELAGTGVDGVALVSAIFAVEDIKSECKELLALSEQMVSL